MPMTPICLALGRARTLFEKLVLAEHYEQLGLPRHAAREAEDAMIWLELTAETFGLKLVEKGAPALVEAATCAREVLQEVHENSGGGDDTITYGALQKLNAALPADPIGSIFQRLNKIALGARS